MTETTAPSTKPRRGFLRRFLQNPITQKELRSRMRGRRAFLTLTAYLVVMAAFILLIYSSYTAGSSNYTLQSRGAGRAVFTTVVFIQTFLAAFIGPAFTSGSISGEKERQTYDLLRTTLLSARSVVVGKLFSALSYVLLLVAASLPLLGIALLLGGVEPIEFVISQVLIVVAALAYALWGMYISTIMRSTLSATVVTYAGTLAMLLGIPFFSLLSGAFIAPFLFSGSTVSDAAILVVFAGLGLAATNLPMTMLFSEIAYFDGGSIWFYAMPLGSRTVTVPSPWWVLIIIYLLFSLFIFWRCIVNVRYIPKR